MTSAPAWRHPAPLAILAALVLLVAWLGVRAVAAVTTPVAIPSLAGAAAPPDLAILSRFDPFFRRQPDAAGDSLPVTSLPLALKGVRLDPVSGRGAAIIAGPDGQQEIYEPGGEVLEGVSLQLLASDHVVLLNAGTREALWLEEAGGPPLTMPVPGPVPGPVAGAAPAGFARAGGAAPAPDAPPDDIAEPETPPFIPEDEDTP